MAVFRRVLLDRKSTRLNSSHTIISYAVFCLKKKNTNTRPNSRGAPQHQPAHHQAPSVRCALRAAVSERGRTLSRLAGARSRGGSRDMEVLLQLAAKLEKAWVRVKTP